jgi:nucleoside-diphosphate-sugar epimerase
MHIALTGASGFIGSVVARRLAERGHTVTALVRATSRRDHVEPYVARFVVGEQADETAWPDLLGDADCVVHDSVDWDAIKANDLDRHLASNLVASIRLLHAAGDRQFVFMSTIAVHHDMRPRWGGIVDEDHPVRPSTLYGAYKAAVEEHMWTAHFQRGVSTCAIRPCAVYGIDPRLERSVGYPIVARVQRERRFDRAGGGKFVHVDDVAEVVTRAVGNPEAAGTVLNMADCYARWTDLARMAADALGLEAEIDDTSPAQSKNRFSKEAVAALGVPMDRGHDGLRAHIGALIEQMRVERPELLASG